MRSNHGQHNDFNDEYENVYANTQIYANANTLAAANDYANANCTIPIGKKPALPPKPSSQANTLKRNRPSTSTTIPATPAMITSIAVAPAMDSINQNSMGKDPAEMSLRERLALFEQSTQRISDPIVAEPRVQIPMPPLPLPKKHLPNSTTEKMEYSTVMRGMPSDHLCKSKYRVDVCELCYLQFIVFLRLQFTVARTMPKPMQPNRSPIFPLAHPKTPPPPIPTKKKSLPAAKIQPQQFELISVMNNGTRNARLIPLNGNLVLRFFCFLPAETTNSIPILSFLCSEPCHRPCRGRNEINC